MLSALALVLQERTPVPDVLCLVDGRIVAEKPLEPSDEGVTIHFENGNVFVPSALVQECVAARSAEHVPRTEEERAKEAQGLVRFEGRWIRPEERAKRVEKRIAERRAEIQERIDHGEWAGRYRATTKSFEFEYTVPPRVFERYRDALEAYFERFSRDWKVRPPRDAKRLKVCFYADRASYRRTSGAPGGALAYFRYVEPLELDAYYDRTDPAFVEDVLFHEANHYLQKLIAFDFSMPHWPGEALAEYYGASEWDPRTGSFSTGLIQEGRLAEIQNDLAGGERFGLQQMITAEGMYEHYTWGWSLVYFLMNSEHAKAFQSFVTDLARAKDVRRTELDAHGLRTVEPDEVWRVFQDRLGLDEPEDVRDLERAWHAFVEEDLAVVTASGLAKAARKAAESGRKIRAKRLYREAIEKGCTSPAAFHQLAELLLEDASYPEAFALLDQALALDPLGAEIYAAKGRALVRRGQVGDKDAGRRWIALAREIGLDDPLLALEDIVLEPKAGGEDD